MPKTLSSRPSKRWVSILMLHRPSSLRFPVAIFQPLRKSPSVLTSKAVANRRRGRSSHQSLNRWARKNIDWSPRSNLIILHPKEIDLQSLQILRSRESAATLVSLSGPLSKICCRSRPLLAIKMSKTSILPRTSIKRCSSLLAIEPIEQWPKCVHTVLQRIWRCSILCWGKRTKN